MSCEEDVLKIGKKLEKMISKDAVDHEQAQDMLKTLQNLPMTLDVLQKTRIGMTVNNFRKAASKDEAITLAKSLIKSWKKLLPGDSTSSSKNGSKKESLSKSSSEKDMEVSDSQESQSQSSPAGSENGRPAELQRQASNSIASPTNDPIRIKCRELLAGALKPPTEDGFGGNQENLAELAAIIEDHIFGEFKNTESKYKNRVRSRVANLRDSKNPKLRENVLMGLIPPDRIASMTAEEMASNEMKELRAKYTKAAIDDHQMAKTGGTETDLFKCGKCGQKKTTYNQVQTRSADEPMTTFVYCMHCGNRWKFC